MTISVPSGSRLDLTTPFTPQTRTCFVTSFDLPVFCQMQKNHSIATAMGLRLRRCGAVQRVCWSCYRRSCDAAARDRFCRCTFLQSARVTVRIECQEQAMTFVSDASLPLPGMPDSAPAPPAFQMMLIGQPQPVRIPERLWRSWLVDPAVVSRFESKRYRRRDRRGVVDRARLLPCGEPARAVSPRDRAGTFVRLPARIRCHLEVGLVQHRRRGVVSSM